MADIITLTHPSQQALESRARRAAQQAGYVARKTRWRKDSIDNWGDFMLVDPRTNTPVAGYKYDMTAQEVIAFCAD
jgi:hypothetical protein